MNRREWLKRAALLIAAGIAADQLELLDRLQPRRLLPAWPSMSTLYGDGVHDDTRALQAFVDGLPVYDAQLRRVLTGDALVIGRSLRISDTIYLHGHAKHAGRRVVQFCVIHGESVRGPILQYHGALNNFSFT